MLRRFILSAAALTTALAFLIVADVQGGQFFALVTKVDGNKITYKKGSVGKEDKQLTYGDAASGEATKDAAITRGGGMGGGGKKGGGKKAGPIEGGLTNELFKNINEKGLTGQITIADEGPNKGKIIAINVTGLNKGKEEKKDEKK